MKTYRVDELDGALLDYAVSQARADNKIQAACYELKHHSRGMTCYNKRGYIFAPSRDWCIGGQLIEKERIELCFHEDYWTAAVISENDYFFGETALIAAMRAYVACKLGKTVDLPE